MSPPKIDHDQEYLVPELIINCISMLTVLNIAKFYLFWRKTICLWFYRSRYRIDLKVRLSAAQFYHVCFTWPGVR